ncbi:hypothetical protein [Bordetella genomosp. 13]|uniref:hypothetical protein n=1 Tax=Bordetella genomosp. 13 TaxID=463040 RepID=UPI0011A667D0|nr:hypothetical protein [Bordetella genomosp. 13]
MRKKLALTLLFPVFLAACGGGGGSDDDDTPPPVTETPPPDDSAPPPPVDPVTQASLATAAQLGLAPIAGNTDSVRVYDLVADMGDSWRLTLNLDTGAYTLAVLYTAYDLTGTSGTFARTANGAFSTVTGAGGVFTLLIDDRTRTIAGTVALGGMTASVSGTAYAAPVDRAVLAGTYLLDLYARALPSESDDGTPPLPVEYQATFGALRIGADGASALCVESTFNAEGRCVDPDGDENPPFPAEVSLNQADGLLHAVVTQSDEQTLDLGPIRVQAGDRGPVLALDVPREGDAIFPITGVTYLVRQQALQGTEMDGAWTCSSSGKPTGTLSISGTALAWTDADGATRRTTLQYNQHAYRDDDPTALPGLASAVFTATPTDGTEPEFDSEYLLPLSASLLLVADYRYPGTMSTCHISGN